ncbi:helix-turn-helix domain-containing protein [Labrys sp. 22185]|uniref:helix-turn-helix domain-containing protein n=1 Tax=Labrys sp. 22185 TaxID=3453888 RepID=UPI003F855A2A
MPRIRNAVILQPGQIWQPADPEEHRRSIVDIFRTIILFRADDRSDAEPVKVTRSEFRRWIADRAAILIAQPNEDEAKASPSAELGKRIVALRNAAGLTQQQVADALNVSRPAVAFWETGREGSVNKHLPGLAQLLGVSVETLLSGHVEQQIDISVTQDEADFIALYRRLSSARKLHAQKWLERQANHLNVAED